MGLCRLHAFLIEIVYDKLIVNEQGMVADSHAICNFTFTSLSLSLHIFEDARRDLKYGCWFHFHFNYTDARLRPILI